MYENKRHAALNSGQFENVYPTLSEVETSASRPRALVQTLGGHEVCAHGQLEVVLLGGEARGGDVGLRALQRHQRHDDFPRLGSTLRGRVLANPQNLCTFTSKKVREFAKASFC